MPHVVLNCKAFSVNAYYYRDHRFKTKEAKAWETELLELLQEHKSLLELADTFREKGGVFRIWITIVYPHHIFYNKSGQVSAKTFDVSNTEKPLIDIIFKNFMFVDDRFIVECTSSKRAGAGYAIHVSLELDSNP